MLENTFFYLRQYGSRRTYSIPTLFDKIEFKPEEKFCVKVTQIYDPSKFWIVSKYKELEIFQKSLLNFYSANTEYRIPQQNILKEMYCVVYLDGGYYRGVVLSVVCCSHEDNVQVFFIDNGKVDCVNPKSLYYMAEKYMQVPQFCIRASLANLCPRTGGQWTNLDTITFSELVNDKVFACCIVNVNSNGKLLDIVLCENEQIPVHKVLMKLGRARSALDAPEMRKLNSRWRLKLSSPYLFPSHEALESGQLPTCVQDANYQLQLAGYSALSVIGRYYTPRKLKKKQC